MSSDVRITKSNPTIVEWGLGRWVGVQRVTKSNLRKEKPIIFPLLSSNDFPWFNQCSMSFLASSASAAAHLTFNSTLSFSLSFSFHLLCFALHNLIWQQMSFLFYLEICVGGNGKGKKWNQLCPGYSTRLRVGPSCLSKFRRSTFASAATGKAGGAVPEISQADKTPPIYSWRHNKVWLLPSNIQIYSNSHISRYCSITLENNSLLW